MFILYYTIFSYVKLGGIFSNIMSLYVILRYVMICRIILCRIILCYVVLCIVIFLCRFIFLIDVLEKNLKVG